jgi:hypothetical protein
MSGVPESVAAPSDIIHFSLLAARMPCITKGYGSSWTFEPFQTYANVLRLVQHRLSPCNNGAQPSCGRRFQSLQVRLDGSVDSVVDIYADDILTLFIQSIRNHTPGRMVMLGRTMGGGNDDTMVPGMPSMLSSRLSKNS